MIQHKQETELYTGKNIESSQFGLMASEKAFNILSDSLYTHKQRATIREYCTNAYDSHQEAGKLQTPFRVHVPTQLEPFFEVEDYGMGLGRYTCDVTVDEAGVVHGFVEDVNYNTVQLRFADNPYVIPYKEFLGSGGRVRLPEGRYTLLVDEVMDIFATFFLSTKEDNEKANGCLGLGSKAAFTVSDQFTVAAIKDGMLRVYMCYKNKMGIPEVALKSEHNTHKGNGVTIRIPVPVSDIALWQKEMTDILSCFELLPEGNLCEIEVELYKAHSSKGDLRSSVNGVVSMNGSGVFDILMGNVVYPIDNPLQYVKCVKLREALRGIINACDVHLIADLGEVSFAPSREALSLNRYTKQALTKKITKLAFAKYHELVGKMQGDMSYYTFYHKFHKTTSWELFNRMVLPFTKGNTLSYYERTWEHNPLCVLSTLLGIENVRGLVPRVGTNSVITFSSSFKYMSHKRVREWQDITICTGEVKGLQKTMRNAKDTLDCGILLYAPNDVTVKALCNFFGLSVDTVVDLTQYQVITERKKALPRPRKERRETVMVKVLHNRDISYQEVDLSESGLCYLPQGETSFNTAIVENMGGVNKDLTTNNFANIMKSLGVSKVLLLSKNNEKKVIKAGVDNIYTLWKELIRADKATLLKSYAWSPDQECEVVDSLNTVDQLLLPKSRVFGKYSNLRNKVKVHPLTHVVSVQSLGLQGDKSFVRECDK